MTGFTVRFFEASPKWAFNIPLSSTSPTLFAINLNNVDPILVESVVAPGVVGAGWFGMDDLAYSPITVPEPSVLALGAFGLASLAANRLLRRQR